MTSAIAIAGWSVSGLALMAAVRILRWRRCERTAAARSCHEIRGALTAIGLGLTSATRGSPLPAPQRRALETELGRAALALQDLEGMRGRVGSADRREPVSVSELLRDAVAAAQVRAGGTGIAVDGEWHGADAVVVGDRRRLAQALANVVGNAVEHGGGVVSVRGSAPGGVQARIEVCDTGPGLPGPVAELARRSHGATRGHGLAIASAVVRGYGGGLTAAPASRGARVVLLLPSVPRGAVRDG